METLVLLLKSLPLDCYFNIYGFGSLFESFYPQSVGYTQQTMAESLQRIQKLQANLGGTEILAPLRTIYCSPCLDGHPHQRDLGSLVLTASFPCPLFVFTDGEVGNTKDIITEVQRHWEAHRCFSFGIRAGASTALIKGIARAAGSSAELITGQDHMQPKALQSLKWALQPAMTEILLSWDLPPGMEAALLGRGRGDLPWAAVPHLRPAPRAAPAARHCCGGRHPAVPHPGPDLQGRRCSSPYSHRMEIGDSNTPMAPITPRLPVYRLASKSLLLELEGAVEARSEGDRCRALETGLSSGVVCSLTAYVGVDTEQGQPVQGPLVRRDIPLAGNPGGVRDPGIGLLCGSAGPSLPPRVNPVLPAPGQEESSGRWPGEMGGSLRGLAPASWESGALPVLVLLPPRAHPGGPRCKGRKACKHGAPPGDRIPGRVGTRGVFPAEAGVSAECRRLMGPGPLAGHRAGGELDRRQGEDAQS
ncbi:unnamed protein product, partial [Natator depressus]